LTINNLIYLIALGQYHRILIFSEVFFNTVLKWWA